MEQHTPLSGMRVLVVDDEPDVLETLEELLYMCTVLKASSFKEAERLLREEPVDLAILDIMGVNGYAILEIARQMNIPAVMLTAHAVSPDHAMKSYKGGAASYVPKQEIKRIVTFLEDVLEAQKEGRDPWWRWLSRLGSFWKKEFTDEWQKQNSEFWDKIKKL
ncbi:MAG: response regulator [Desulfobacterales bacterium]|nr:response regulator [Desulfobacterales bacterium]